MRKDGEIGCQYWGQCGSAQERHEAGSTRGASKRPPLIVASPLSFQDRGDLLGWIDTFNAVLRTAAERNLKASGQRVTGSSLRAEMGRVFDGIWQGANDQPNLKPDETRRGTKRPTI